MRGRRNLEPLVPADGLDLWRGQRGDGHGGHRRLGHEPAFSDGLASELHPHGSQHGPRVRGAGRGPHCRRTGCQMGARAGGGRRRGHRPHLLDALVEYAARTSFAVDSWFMRTPAAMFDGVPLGEMALFTAIAFLAASAALVSMAWSRPARHGRVVTWAGAASTIAGAIGLVFTLGYLFSPNAPLLYGGESIPMALNTAIAFVILGTGLAVAAGSGVFPLRRLCGSSISARLLRVFLPLVAGTVVVVAWLTHVVATTAGSSSTAISSAALATVAIFVFGFTLEQISGKVRAGSKAPSVHSKRPMTCSK